MQMVDRGCGSDGKFFLPERKKSRSCLHPCSWIPHVVNRPIPSGLFFLNSFSKVVRVQNFLICKKMSVQEKIISIQNVVHQDSSWNRGDTDKPGNGLLVCRLLRKTAPLLVGCSWKYHCYTCKIKPYMHFWENVQFPDRSSSRLQQRNTNVLWIQLKHNCLKEA